MKKILSAIMVVLLLFSLVACAKMVDDVTDMATDDNTTNQNSEITDTMPEASAKITKEKAEDAAFNHANVKRADVQSLKTELDTENGKLEYDIEFIYAGNEYDYEIDAKTGEVLNFNKEMAD